MPDQLTGPDAERGAATEPERATSADPDLTEPGLRAGPAPVPALHAEPEPALDPPPAPTARATTLSLAILATLALFVVILFLPLPYAIASPGPTKDTLGSQDGTPLIAIKDTETYPSTGQLRMTTVSFSGGPGYPVTLPLVVQAWFSGTQVVTPVESVFPPARSAKEIDQENKAEMVSSQENATVAALEELGYTVPAKLVIAGTVDGTGAVDVLKADDVVVGLQGKPVATYTDLIDALKAIEPGQKVSISIERAGAPLTVEVVTGKREGGGSSVGVYIDPTFTLPVDVTIAIKDIGGPSAGNMFALGIIDKLTPADEANGVTIAGTGTMDVDGTVGPIGGIRQKLAGAKRDGATWFLAPAGNCDEVVGHVPAGLHVAKVATLHESRLAMEAIGAGKGSTLATCTAG